MGAKSYKIVSREPEGLDQDPSVTESGPSIRQEGQSTLSDGRSVELNQTSSRDSKAAQAAPLEREPERRDATAPVPLPPSRIKYTQFKVGVEPDLLEQIKRLAREDHLTIQEFTNVILKAGLAVYQGTQTGSNDPKAVYQGTQTEPKTVYQGTHSIDHRSLDLDLDRSDLIDLSKPVYLSDPKQDEALAFYSKKTRRPVTEYDKRAYREGTKNDRGEFLNSRGQFTGPVAKVPNQFIRRGIVDSMVRSKRGPVGTFAYCLGAIHQAVEEHMREQKGWAVDADEQIQKLRMKAEARGNQEMLPTVGAELVDLSDVERDKVIRERLGYHGPDAKEPK